MTPSEVSQNSIRESSSQASDHVKQDEQEPSKPHEEPDVQGSVNHPQKQQISLLAPGSATTGLNVASELEEVAILRSKIDEVRYAFTFLYRRLNLEYAPFVLDLEDGRKKLRDQEGAYYSNLNDYMRSLDEIETLNDRAIMRLPDCSTNHHDLNDLLQFLKRHVQRLCIRIVTFERDKFI